MYHQVQSRRRKKRHTHGIKTVEVTRGKGGYGFTISGQHPCILSCIVSGSPADNCGLKTGDYLIAVNGLNIAKSPHDDVVRLIGSSSGLLVLQIAENCNDSDSSEEESNFKKHSSRVRFKPGRTQPSDKVGASRYNDLHRRKTGLRVNGKISEDHFNYEEDDARHPYYDDMYRGGNENINPQIGTGYSRRHMKHSAAYRSGAIGHRSKHTIVTREARLAHGARDNMNRYHRQHINHEPAVFRSNRRRDYRSHHYDYKMQFGGHNMSWQSTSSSNSTSSMTPQDLSNILFPSLKPHVHGHPDYYIRDMLDDDDSIEGVDPDVTVIVAYIGSIEMPHNAPGSHQLQSIRSAVSRLRFEHKVHTLVLMTVLITGIKLRNSLGNLIAHYPADKIAFSGTCPDDQRFFGIVTLHNVLPEANHNNSVSTMPGSSCHVFMVDPDIAKHSVHHHTACTFGLQCSPNNHTDGCLEFPMNANSVLHGIAKLYKHRQEGLMNIPGGPLPLASDSSITSSSNSDSGLGFKEEAAAAAIDHVYVVDMDKKAQGQSLDSTYSTTDQSLQTTENTTNGSSLYESWQVDDEVTSAFTPIQQHYSYSSFLTGTSDSMSSENHVPALAEKLNVRAMPDPQGFDPNSEKQYEQQHSAQNLRKSAHRIIQSRQLPSRNTSSAFSVSSDADSLHSLELNSKGNSTSTLTAQGAISGSSSVTEPEDTEQRYSPKASIRTTASRRPIPVSIPLPPSPYCGTSLYSAEHTPSHKPPLPERRPILPRRHPRTPAPLPREAQLMKDRPKSTPPRPAR